MINIYPAFQILYTCMDIGYGVVAYGVYGTETLARTDPDAQSFVRPEGTSWRSVDLRIANILQQNAAKIPFGDKSVFINVSQFSLNDDESFYRWMAAIEQLREALGPSTNLVVEITEHVTPEALASRWGAMKAAGLNLAIDDYGVGESTLTRLQMYPWDYCKFDLLALKERQFHAGADHCIKEKIVGIAEKVETKTHSAIALAHGLTIQQGYLFSRPITRQLPFKENLACEIV